MKLVKQLELFLFTNVIIYILSKLKLNSLKKKPKNIRNEKH